MNDDQRLKMLATLAIAFDQASTRCSHCGQAALLIEQELRKAGFVIAMKRQRLAVPA